MEQDERELPASALMASREYLTIPYKAYSYVLSKISGRCFGSEYASIKDREEETMLGYESSWAGIYKNDHMQQ
ncbi:MAG TPA: hypothetical protein VIX18_12450 [Nitrospirota bacterium]